MCFVFFFFFRFNLFYVYVLLCICMCTCVCSHGGEKDLDLENMWLLASMWVLSTSISINIHLPLQSWSYFVLECLCKTLKSLMFSPVLNEYVHGVALLYMPYACIYMHVHIFFTYVYVLSFVYFTYFKNNFLRQCLTEYFTLAFNS